MESFGMTCNDSGIADTPHQESESMAKRIAFCADGTWDNSNSRSNVYKLYKSLLVSGDQMPFYDDGVGADGNIILKVVEGASGIGLRQKIKDGYTKIAHVYEAGDQIFIFGFSRGAFTARSLAGMIAACGLPTENFSTDLVNKAFEAYEHESQRKNILESLSASAMDAAKITMIGVWDTVGSIGISSVLGGVDPVDDFLDTNLHPNVLNAYHALSIDEKRPQFQPTLWNTASADQTLEQVWFSGYHSDVGGGVSGIPANEKALSDIPLAWMISKASALGLAFDPLVLEALPVPIDPSYALLPLNPPNAGVNQVEPRVIADGATLADSVIVRCQDPSRRPRNLKFVNGALASSYKIATVVKPMQTGVGG
jgi:uncharacterized protein (DUF2235 family)